MTTHENPYQSNYVKTVGIDIVKLSNYIPHHIFQSYNMHTHYVQTQILIPVNTLMNKSH